MSLQRISIINAKGGSGKSTIAMNLAVLFSAAQQQTTILDYDPQGSCLHWAALRPSNCPKIHVRDAVRLQSKLTRSFQLSLPVGTEHLIMDTPAGLAGAQLSLFLQKSDIVLVPIAPSVLDVQASGQFLKALVKEARIRNHQVQVGIIINRSRQSQIPYAPLIKLIEEIKLPVITSLSDSPAYVSLSEQGLGIHDETPKSSYGERDEWLPLARWLSLSAAGPLVGHQSSYQAKHQSGVGFSPKLIANAQ